MSKFLTQQQFLEKARQQHGDKYDYSQTIYKSARDIITVICPTHGRFNQVAYYHQQGRGCSKCADEATSLRCRHSLEKFVKLANIKHDNKYDYSKVTYRTNKHPVVILCPRHGEFLQRPDRHLYGCGCKQCSRLKMITYNVSDVETDFLDTLQVPLPNRTVNINNGQYFVDGLVNNTIYEFLGDYWHGHRRMETGLKAIDMQIRRLLTEYRFQQIQKITGLTIKYIWECDWREYKAFGGTLNLRTFNGTIEF